MKHLFFTMAVAALISCNNTENKTPSTNTSDTIITKASGTDTPTPQGKVLENELKNFITVLTSKDPSKIKQLFTFPVSDSTLGFWDSMGNQLGHNNKGLVTEEMFSKNFDRIYKFWMGDNVAEFSVFLKKIQLDSLTEKKEISFEETYKKTQPCYKYYIAKIDNDTVSLSYGYYANSDFRNPNSDISECEFNIFWDFKFDGKKLIFIRQSAAG